MDIIKSKQAPSDDLTKVMNDLAKDGVPSHLEVDNDGIPENITPPPPPSMPDISDRVKASSKDATVKSTQMPKPGAAPPPPPSIPTTNSATDSDDLNSIKLDAVEMLKPLIGSLDISPEEKFEAMIEIIRASDDQEMISQAFDTAKSISDNDKRAQALIDIINEINYINKIKNS